MKNKKKILVVAAHPDDELLGCGGSLIKLSKKKYEIFALFFTDGVSARDKKNKKIILNRKNNSLKSLKIMGVKNTKFLSYPDNNLDKVSLIKIVKEIENVIFKFKPETIFTHSNVDLNIDHEIISRAVVTASRPKPNFSVKMILLFETLSSTEWNFYYKKKSFNPNYFIDITSTIDKKIKAAKAYKNEINAWPHPRSIKGIKNLAKYRGQSVGLKYAEAFYLLRHIA
jgi:LmbE family N-acetylglucosaminyl deacetylase